MTNDKHAQYGKQAVCTSNGWHSVTRSQQPEGNKAAGCMLAVMVIIIVAITIGIFSVSPM